MTDKFRVTLVSFWSLLGVWLLANQLRAQPADVRAEKDGQVSGFAQNENDARVDAIKQAARKIASLVAKRHPSLANWQPSLQYVEENCVESKANYEELPLDNPNVKGIKCTL